MKQTNGTEHELDFWRRFIHTEQFATWLETGRTPELDVNVAEFIHQQVSGGGMVLDIASGVCSILNGWVPNQQLRATDLLGDDYAAIFDYGTHDIIQPLAYRAEELPKAWNGKYSIVHIRNGLDHCQDIQRAYQHMLDCCAKGGHIIIQGFEREATFENYRGLHQHDLYLKPGWQGIYVDGKNTSFVIGAEEAVEEAQAYSYPLDNGKTWMVWIGRKK